MKGTIQHLNYYSLREGEQGEKRRIPLYIFFLFFELKKNILKKDSFMDKRRSLIFIICLNCLMSLYPNFRDC